MNNYQIEANLQQQVKDAFKQLFNAELSDQQATLQLTRKEFEGHYTLVVFPLLKLSKTTPEQTAQQIGEYLCQMPNPIIDKFNVVKGFLNLSVRDAIWLNFLNSTTFDANYGYAPSRNQTKMIEYSSPNTNKPLHLGHIRNNLLGYSIAKILTAAGYNVIKANLVNDRGIHICKSMLAWQKWGNNITPETAGKKGDHLVGDFYVRFDQEYKKEVQQLIQSGLSKEDAEKEAPLLKEAQLMLKRWEEGDPGTIKLWQTMNDWVYQGFDITYKTMGVNFDKIYYESQTYLLGKKIVQQGLDQNVFYRRDDNSVWINLQNDGLDEKLLLRSDGTSVYMTQDLGTACQRFEEYPLNSLIYVVGNEQNYHFQVLALVLKKLGYQWADGIYHMSYGMVELPEGKMKSREGTVVDADDLMEEMFATSRAMSEELGKLSDFNQEEQNAVIQAIGLAALKYFILKVDPKKTMLFDPKESIDFNGNTGPFIQYTHARICSVLRKATDLNLSLSTPPADLPLQEKEISLIRMLYQFPTIVIAAADNYSPALIANYVYDLAKEYNQFYHDFPILKEQDTKLCSFRLLLSKHTATVIKTALDLLGITAPERM